MSQFPIKEKYSLKDKIDATTIALKEHMSLRNASEVAYLSEKYGEGILDISKENINLNEVFRYYAPTLNFIEQNKCMDCESYRNTLLRNSHKRNFDDFLILFNKYQNSFKEQEVKNIIYAMGNYSRQNNENRQNAENFIENYQSEINKYNCWSLVFHEVKNLSPEFIINHKDNINDDFEKYIEVTYGHMNYLEDLAKRNDGTSAFYKNGQPKIEQLDDNLKIGDKVCCLKHLNIGLSHEIFKKTADIVDIYIDNAGEKHYVAEVDEWDSYSDKKYSYSFNFTEENFYKEVFPNEEYYDNYLLELEEQNKNRDEDEEIDEEER